MNYKIYFENSLFKRKNCFVLEQDDELGNLPLQDYIKRKSDEAWESINHSTSNYLRLELAL